MSSTNLEIKIEPTRSAMYPRNLFVYCAYWGTYSRVLQFMNTRGSMFNLQVEVDLTAVNITNAYGWEKIANINIRRHGTDRSARDIYMAELPSDALWHMKKWLSDEVIHRLLHEDFLPQIDWDLYNRNNNGGCALAKCTKRSTETA